VFVYVKSTFFLFSTMPAFRIISLSWIFTNLATIVRVLLAALGPPGFRCTLANWMFCTCISLFWFMGVSFSICDWRNWRWVCSQVCELDSVSGTQTNTKLSRMLQHGGLLRFLVSTIVRLRAICRSVFAPLFTFSFCLVCDLTCSTTQKSANTHE